MGGSSYSLDTRAATRCVAAKSAAAKGYADTFTYTADIRSGKVKAGVHEKLDPKKMNKGVRESRDSVEHPESVGVVVGTDVTGSFSTLPKVIVGKVPDLLGAIIKNGALDHPHILFSAVGDAYCDASPFQVGQFEAGTEIEEDLDKFHLEGGGGGNSGESYDLWFYFLARCCSMDCLEKRGKKGYAFLIEDEPYLSKVSKDQVLDVFGHTIQGDILIEDIVKEALEKFEIYIIRPRNVHYGLDAATTHMWEKLLPGRLIPVQSIENVCDIIALKIAANEGVDLDMVIKGLSVESEVKALAVIKSGLKNNSKSITAKSDGSIVTKPSKGRGRL